MKTWTVSGRTARTTWIELDSFATQEAAQKFASEVLSKGGQEVMIESSESFLDDTSVTPDMSTIS